ncbi:hypothetical protein HY312_01415 [Candidatus Saccharibacteria bacterium]|nr:hypothetical protein [Candidatus Saccharibacteria bacterium]
MGTKNDARYNLKIVNNDDDRENYTVSSDDLGDDTGRQPADNGADTGSDYARSSRKELAELDDLDI